MTDLLILTDEGERTPRVEELLVERFGPREAYRRERVQWSPPYDPTLARAREVEKPPPAPEGIDSLLDLLVDEGAAPC